MADVFAVDFDGVLCDSAGEVAVSAWRAGAAIWPEWRALGPEPPPESVARFRRLRPLIETGHQAILLMRLVFQGAEGATDAELAALEERLAGEGWGRARLVELFGRTRDEWLLRDLPDWLGRHGFYPGALEALSTRLGTDAVFIVTTKQERFVEALLRSRRLFLPPGHIFGLNPLKSKEDVLEELSGRRGHAGVRLHFVEDRLLTLLRVAERAGLEHVELYLAAWGYNTEEERALARAHPRITVWSLPEFLWVKESRQSSLETEDV
ncbi:MAG: HAD family hydrolase [Deltaproteobacteria bacterium]|nr:HAD family hydrolase [Deltaproteobacteria bacterium]